MARPRKISTLACMGMAALLAINLSAASAEEWFSHPLAGETSRLPITSNAFTPPAWLQTCQVLTADASGQIHLPECTEGESLKTDRQRLVAVGDQHVLQRIQEVNSLMNALLLSDGLEDMKATAEEKRRFLLSYGLPSSGLLLAYVTFEVITIDGTSIEADHVVLVVRLDTGDLVLDSKLQSVVDVLPWEFSPYRFYGIESPLEPGKWLAVLDDRDDPLEYAYEWICVTEDCTES